MIRKTLVAALGLLAACSVSAQMRRLAMKSTVLISTKLRPTVSGATGSSVWAVVLICILATMTLR